MLVCYSITDRSFLLQNLENIHMLLPYCLDYNCCGDLHLVYAWCHMLVMVNVAHCTAVG